MASLYDIDEKLYYLIEEGFDPETGEVLEGFDLNKAINEATMELDKKLEGICCFIKNLESDVDAIKNEQKQLMQRRKSKENKIESLKKYLDGYFKFTQADYFNDTTGEIKFRKFETPKCLISYRKSDSVEVIDVNKVPQEYIKPRKLTEDDVDKTNIKKLLKKGETIDGAILLNKKNISVK